MPVSFHQLLILVLKSIIGAFMDPSEIVMFPTWKSMETSWKVRGYRGNALIKGLACPG